MSENLTETFHGQEKFESSHTFDQEQQQEQPNETQIFELINQLNDAFANNSKQQQESNLIRSIEPISSESNTNPIQNESSHSSNNKSDTQDASNKLANESKANNATKIPRIPYLRKSSMNEPTLTAKLSEHLTNKPVSNSNSLSAASSNNSISTTASTNHSSTRQPQQQQQRITRSTIKSAGNSSSSSSKDVSSKRGISLSKNASTSTKARAASITAESREELLNSLKNTKQVKYVIKHQPKQSQVKIFSQKLELKNVSSKIGSLEKATYAPGGGNVKIETRKLTWKAESKIGSLENATYQPKGGNVKIETKKLNFREKAKPKTDTGLVVIETVNSNGNSQFNSNEKLDDSFNQNNSSESN